MSMLLLCLTLGIRLLNPHMNDGWAEVGIDGDSNTNAAYFTRVWPIQLDETMTAADLDYGYVVRSVAYGGKTVRQMVDGAAAEIDPFIRYPGVCIIMGGVNDLAGGASQDTTYQRIVTFCNQRRAAGWYVILCTYPSGDSRAAMPVVNDSLVVHYATFADDIILLHNDANIGDLSDSTNLTYWVNTGHISETGAGIVADSVWKHLEPVIYNLRRGL